MKGQHYIIFSILIFIVIVCMYYSDIFRYMMIKISSSEKYITNYSKLPKTLRNRVVLSFSTTPENIKNLEPMINSLLDQTVKVDEISLFLPDYIDSIKTKKDYEIPNFIKNVANIYPSGKNYGEGTNLVPCILREKESDTIIIGLKENIIYGKTFVEDMLEKCQNNPNTLLVDNNNYSVLLRPEYIGSELLERDQDTYNNKWFLQQAKNSKIIDYPKNYSY